MKTREDLTGQKFGRLTVLEFSHRGNFRQSFWKCQCNCGNIVFVRAGQLKFGTTKSCGCLQKEKVSKLNFKHGMKDTKIHNSWRGMRERCINKNHNHYKSYGGRGITVCDEWNDIDNGFINFYNWAMNNGYEEGLTIERIDVNGNYEPSNCKWVTNTEQANNKRNTIYLKYNNKTQSLLDWCKELNLDYTLVRSRIKEYNWSIEKAFTTEKWKGREWK